MKYWALSQAQSGRQSERAKTPMRPRGTGCFIYRRVALASLWIELAQLKEENSVTSSNWYPRSLPLTPAHSRENEKSLTSSYCRLLLIIENSPIKIMEITFKIQLVMPLETNQTEEMGRLGSGIDQTYYVTDVRTRHASSKLNHFYSISMLI